MAKFFHTGPKITPNRNLTLFCQNIRFPDHGCNPTGIYPFKPSIISAYAFILHSYEAQNNLPMQPNFSNKNQDSKARE